MVRHKPTGSFISGGMYNRSALGKIWRTPGHLNSAITSHTKYGDHARPDFIRNPSDYEVIVLKEADHVELTQWFEWRTE